MAHFVLLEVLTRIFCQEFLIPSATDVRPGLYLIEVCRCSLWLGEKPVEGYGVYQIFPGLSYFEPFLVNSLPADVTLQRRFANMYNTMISSQNQRLGNLCRNSLHQP